MPKISVVVPAYRPGAGLDRVIASLDAQTMPQHEFEVVIVDDGSPDDTFERLTEMRRTRPNLIIERIEPSGWASRPRNVGTALATGDYVLYMDSDDHLYPQALQRCWDFAVEHRSDIVSPKESKTNAPWWGMDRWDANKANIVGEQGIEGLLPMMPHKLYRRSMLVEHGIVFPESVDGQRVLWEDIWFNIEAYRHAEVVSVLSDTPVYRWHWTAGSISKSYGPLTGEFWIQLERLCAYIADALADDPKSRDAMLLHQFRDRCLLRFSRVIKDASAAQLATALESARRIQDTYMPPELEARLGKASRARGALLRAERTDLMQRLWEVDRQMASRTTATAMVWRNGALELSAETTLTAAGAPLLFRSSGDRVVRSLPDELTAAIPAAILDVTDDLPAFQLSMWVRSRDERVTWAVPFERSASFEPVNDGRLRVVVRSLSRIDPRTGGFGVALDDAIWDVWSQTNWIGTAARSGVASELRRATALTEGVAAVAYRNKNDELSLDLAQLVRSAVSDGAPDLAAITGTIAAFTVPLTEVSVTGRSDLPMTIRLEPANDTLRRGIETGRVPSVIARRLTASMPGRLVADDDGARLVGGGSVHAGSFRMAFETRPGRPVVTNLVLHVGGDGSIVFTTRRIVPAGRPAQQARSRFRATAVAGRILARLAATRVRNRLLRG